MISLVLTARPSYAKLQTVIAGLLARRADIELIVCGGAVLERFGRVADIVRQQFPALPITELYSTLEGHNVRTSALSTASLLHSLADHFARVRPRIVVVVADRYEVLAAAQAAAYQNIPVAHLQGGETSGNIDNRVRDAITALSTYHFPATLWAQMRVGELTRGQGVNVCAGCPSVDIARQALTQANPVTMSMLGGTGARFDLQHPFIVVLNHSETERPQDAAAQMHAILEGVQAAELPAVVFWPGMDAGQEQAAKELRLVMERHREYLHAVRTLPPLTFLMLLRQARCLVGNSSAGIRECSYIGTQVVNVGQRQRGRERAKQVHDVARYDPHVIRAAILHATAFGPEPMSELYGRGDAGEQIADKLVTVC